MLLNKLKACSNPLFCVKYISGDSKQSNKVLAIGKWEVPSVGWYKLTVDVAVDKVNGTVGYGAVMRNSDGHVMVVGAYQGIFSDDVDICRG